MNTRLDRSCFLFHPNIPHTSNLTFNPITMKFAQYFLSLVLATASVASPTPTLEKRATTICGQWDTVATGTYTIYQDLWGISGYTCSQCTSDTSNSLVWPTSWSWSGGSSQVKSYANAGLTIAAKRVPAISKIPTTWKWR